MQVSHVFLNAELPEDVAVDLASDAGKIQTLQERLRSDVFASDSTSAVQVQGSNKINMKRLNSKIFWFEPKVDSMIEFRQVPSYLRKMISFYSDASQLDQIVNDYFRTFPDPWTTAIGINLFYN